MPSAKYAKPTKTKEKALENEKFNLTEENYSDAEENYSEIADIFKIPNSQNLVRALFSNEEIKAYLQSTIQEYALLEDGTIEKDILNEAELNEALRLEIIEPETNHESHHSTAANVISYISKAVDSAPKLFVGLVAFAAAFNTANAFRMLNNSIPDNFDADNSDVVLHNRSKRDNGDTLVTQHVTLSNGNCVMIGLEDHPAVGLVLPWKSVHVKCLGEPCYNQLFYLRDNGDIFEWGYSLKNLKAVADSDLGIDVTFVHTPYSSTGPKLSNIHKYKCDDLGLSPRYQHLENCKKLKSEGHNEEALIECTKSLKADPNFKLAIKLTKELKELIPAVNTIEPFSSAYLIEGNSTTTTNSTYLIEDNSTTTTNFTTPTEKTTTHIEANNAPFKGIATTTTTQNTTNQGWSAGDLCKTVLSVLFTGGAIACIVTLVYKKGSAIYNQCLKCFNGSLEESHSKDKQSDHLSNCETLPENMQNTTMKVLNDVLNVAENANTFSNAFAAKGANIFINALNTTEEAASLIGGCELTESEPL
ncbi:MAG: hypothetical protein LN569_03370 [Rickettsia endosymbiont of Labidopullus appendiculatus]|nr:hypothetical protein [Rickettsia endosymbiont of Labidopullus appendiculatus]